MVPGCDEAQPAKPPSKTSHTLEACQAKRRRAAPRLSFCCALALLALATWHPPLQPAFLGAGTPGPLALPPSSPQRRARLLQPPPLTPRSRRAEHASVQCQAPPPLPLASQHAATPQSPLFSECAVQASLRRVPLGTSWGGGGLGSAARRKRPFKQGPCASAGMG